MNFKFQKNDQIGAAAAEEDEFLSTCFVDTGNLALLEDLSDHRLIVLGRAGSGKTALFSKLKEKHPHTAILVSPESLALSYVSNSTILNFYTNLGVNLDPFFKLLWRHVFAIEIFRTYYGHYQYLQPRGILDRLRETFIGNSAHDRRMKEAIRYLECYDNQFWLESESRVKHIITKVEKDLQDAGGIQLRTAISCLQGGRASSSNLSTEERTDLCRRAQDVISTAQIQDLNKVLDLVNAVLIDKQRPHFVLIDKLDENWVDERIRYKLIMALIHTARDFMSVRNAKVVIALRRDLIDRVFRLTRDSGFQEEKYRSLYLTLDWEPTELVEILDKRINALVARRYTSAPVTHRDLLPLQVGGQRIAEYFTARTLRPRDVIAFFNECIAVGTDLTKLGEKQLKTAEGNYSRTRLRALGDEWSSECRGIVEFSAVLNKRSKSFKIGSITTGEVNEICLDLCCNEPGGTGPLYAEAMRVVECQQTVEEFLKFLMHIFFNVGLVGLKVSPQEEVAWVTQAGKSVSFAEITADTSVQVHPMYYRALGVGRA